MYKEEMIYLTDWCENRNKAALLYSDIGWFSSFGKYDMWGPKFFLQLQIMTLKMALKSSPVHKIMYRF